MPNKITHEELFAVVRVLETDYSDYGGKVTRWINDDKNYSDCSSGCRWAVWLKAPFNGDWCVCTKPNAPRSGLLTFEHQAGYECFEGEEIV